MKKKTQEPEPLKQWRMTYHVTADDQRVFEKTLYLEAPNSQAALSKGLRLLLDNEKSWKISRFEQVWPGAAPA